MKSEELIFAINLHMGQYKANTMTAKYRDEIIKRLKELEELKGKLKEIKMKDYVDQALIDELLKV